MDVADASLNSHHAERNTTVRVSYTLHRLHIQRVKTKLKFLKDSVLLSGNFSLPRFPLGAVAIVIWLLGFELCLHERVSRGYNSC